MRLIFDSHSREKHIAANYIRLPHPCFANYSNWQSRDVLSPLSWYKSYPEHTAWIWIWMTKRRGTTSDNGFIFQKNKRKEKKNPVSCFRNNPIYPLLSTWISTWMEPKELNSSLTYLITTVHWGLRKQSRLEYRLGCFSIDFEGIWLEPFFL